MKILFILSRFPYPLEKGDKLRAYQQLLNLHKSGHEVHLIAISDQKVPEKALKKIEIYCKAITIIPLSIISVFLNLVNSLFRKLPLQVGYFFSTENQKKINSVISELNPDLIYCQLIRTACYAKGHSSIPRVIDYQDAFSKGTYQRMKGAPWWLKPLFNRELALVKEFEKKAYEWFNGHTIISKQDSIALSLAPDQPVSVVPNGVDTSFFVAKNLEKKVDITFVGNMNYPPNVDAVCFLIEEIMPLVWKQFPFATVQIAGANPTKKVKSLGTGLVTVTGWVDDIRDCYRTTKIFVAPMRIGTGLQNKLLEAMAMGIPCVTTPLSFEPLGAIPEVDILVAREASEIADQIIRLLSDDGFCSKIGNNGLKFVHSNYSLEHSQLLLNEVLSDVVKNFKH